ncbi:MAG TPA: hypothetical protein VFH97_00430 [Gemmatimonadales bacterium]|nr:hypothetical protein [Gemmatimonadales bacterium]
MPASPQDSLGTPSPVLPAQEGVPYTQAAWDDEAFMLFAEGRDPTACPSCGRIGFYGPRVGGDGTRLRACRFCGFLQVVNQPPNRAVPAAHHCPTWPEVAKAPYVWWLAPGVTSYHCPFCDEQVTLEESRVTAPSDEPSHPWWKVPQGRSRFYYARFWENWPYTKGRVFL